MASQSSQLNQPMFQKNKQVGHWHFNRLNNSDNICFDMMVPYRPFYPGFCSVLGLYHFITNLQNRDPYLLAQHTPIQPIQEIVMGRLHYRGNEVEDCDRSLVAVKIWITPGATAHVLKTLGDEVHKYELDSEYSYDRDNRFKISFTARVENATEIETLKVLFNNIHTMLPFSKENFNNIETILSKPEQEFKQDYLYTGMKKIVINEPNFFHAHPTLFHDLHLDIYDPNNDREIVQYIPEIINLLINDEYYLLKDKLAQNFNLALIKDPFGNCAHDLAGFFAPARTLQLFIKALKNIHAPNKGCINRLRNHETLLEIEQSIGMRNPDYIKGINQKTLGERKKINDKMLSERKAAYLKQLEQPFPKRKALHVSCIKGDIELVKKEISAEKARIEEKDPRGFTPLLLAAVNQHYALTEWLLAQGADIQNVTHEDYKRRLIDHAFTPEIMELCIYYGLNIELYNNDRSQNSHLVRAIKENNSKMLKYLLFHLKSLPKFQGLSLIELAVQYCSVNGGQDTKCLDLLLRFHDGYVYAGPYDSNLHQVLKELKLTHLIKARGACSYDIPTNIVELLVAHNKRIMRNNVKKLHRPKLHGLSWLETNILHETLLYTPPKNSLLSEKLPVMTQVTSISKSITTLHLIKKDPRLLKDQNTSMKIPQGAFEIQSEIKSVLFITEEERQAISDLFFNIFSMAKEEDTVANRKKYINYALADNPDKECFIQLFKVNGQVVLFVTFEFERGNHPDVAKLIETKVEDYILVHGKLAANNPNFSSLGLTNLALCRIPLILKKMYPDCAILEFQKAIAPGYAVCLMPDYLDCFPKKEVSHSLMEDIAKRVNENPTGQENIKTLRAKLHVQPSRQPNFMHKDLAYFQHLTKKHGAGNNTLEQDRAMSILYALTEGNSEKLFREVFFNGITPHNLYHLAKNFNCLRELNKQERKAKLPRPSL